MRDESDFANSQKHEVVIYHETLGEFGRATLSFGGNEWAHIELEDFLSRRNLSEGMTYRMLKAKTSFGKFFSLFDCKYMGFYIHVDFVVDGDVGENFKTIGIRYTDISEWFMAQQRVGGTVGEAIAWSNHAKPIAVHVKTDDEDFFLKSDIVGTMKRSGEDHLIHEHVLFSFEKSEGCFVVEDVRQKALELSSLLSVLLAYPLSVVSTQVRCDKGRTHYVYFPTHERVERDRTDRWFELKCFVRKSALDDHWPSIFQKYYQSDYRKLSWVRLAGMQRYEGFWEYKALGYVSLLDRYVTQRSLGQKPTHTSPTKKLEKLRVAAKKISTQLSDEQCDALTAAADKIFLEKRELYFSEKYDYATKNSNEDVVKIINISPEDFKLIKHVRDKIAHGDAVDFLGNELGKISIIVDKIALLLTYWAFSDFGLTPDDFIKCLTANSHNRLANNPALNRIHLARISGTADFYQVSKATLAAISKKGGSAFSSCFTEGKRGAIKYSKKYSDIYRSWHMNVNAMMGMHSFDEMFGVEKDRLKHSSDAYMECRDKWILLRDVYIIKDAG